MGKTIERIQLGDREFIILGTAHVSKESVDEVDQLIREEKPDRVCIEIDESRYKSLTQKSTWSDLNITDVLKQGKGFLLLANLVLASFQKRLGLDLGVKPGEEMMTAIKVSEELHIPFSFCDREIHVTLRRAWSKTGFWGKNKMLAALISSALVKEKLSAEEIEKLKEKNVLENMMDELAEFLPSVKTVLIDERDRYLASKIFEAQGKKIVAVVGAGHMNGLIDHLRQFDAGLASTDVSDINIIPPKSLISKILPWVVTGLIVSLFTLGFIFGGPQKGINMIGAWLIATSSMAAIGTIAALGHPLAVLLAFLTGPVTPLLPVIGVGMVTGFVQYKFRKPRVSDFEKLNDDITTVKGFYRNRFTHILLVFMMSNFGVVLGTYAVLPLIAVLLGQ
ncbi:MAG: TraB/GumN family protein [Spirochaetales bacterium]|nr:TraB/GumN family protein [Spirochaetales bacterium]